MCAHTSFLGCFPQLVRSSTVPNPRRYAYQGDIGHLKLESRRLLRLRKRPFAFAPHLCLSVPLLEMEGLLLPLKLEIRIGQKEMTGFIWQYLPLSLCHCLSMKLKRKVSPVMEYRPVSPVAPPNRTTLFLLTRVIVCPNLA